MIPQRTISLRGWLISAFVLLVLVGTGVMMALLYGIREALVEREGRIVFRQLADHLQAELALVLSPLETNLLVLRDWLVSGELDPLDRAEIERRLAPLAASSTDKIALAVQRQDEPVLTFTSGGEALPPVDEGLRQARLLAEARADGNREGRPDVAWSRVDVADSAWVQLSVSIQRKDGITDTVAVLAPVEDIQRASARLRHRPEVIGFWLWDFPPAPVAGVHPARPLRSDESAAVTQLLELWKSTPGDRDEAVLGFVIAGERYRGTVRSFKGTPDGPLICGVVAPESILLPAFRELGPSLCVVALAGLVLAACVGWGMSRRLRRPLESATLEILRAATGESPRPYWPRTRLRELWHLFSAVEELGRSLLPETSAQDAVDHQERHPAVRALRKWAEREPEQAAGNHAPSPAVDESIPDTVSQSPVSEDATPAALVLALETARQQLRIAREALETAHGQMNAAGARDRSHRQHLERLRATLVGLSRLDMRHARSAQARYDRFIAVAAEAIGALRASLWIFEANRTRLRLRAAYDRAEERAEFPELMFRDRLKGFFTAIETETVILCADLNTLPFPDLVRAWMGPLGVTSFAGVPLVQLGELVGLLVVERGGEPQPWTSDDEALLLAIGAMAASLAAVKEEPTAPDSLFSAPPTLTRLDQAVKRGAGIVWEADSIGCITFIAGAVQDTYGYTPEELRGKPLSCLAEHPDQAVDLDRLLTLLAGEPCVPYTCTHRRKDGTLVRMLVSARPIIGENGGTTGASGTAILLEAIP